MVSSFGRAPALRSFPYWGASRRNRHGPPALWQASCTSWIIAPLRIFTALSISSGRTPLIPPLTPKDPPPGMI